MVQCCFGKQIASRLLGQLSFDQRSRDDPSGRRNIHRDVERNAAKLGQHSCLQRLDDAGYGNGYQVRYGRNARENWSEYSDFE